MSKCLFKSQTKEWTIKNKMFTWNQLVGGYAKNKINKYLTLTLKLFKVFPAIVPLNNLTLLKHAFTNWVEGFAARVVLSHIIVFLQPTQLEGLGQVMSYLNKSGELIWRGTKQCVHFQEREGGGRGMNECNQLCLSWFLLGMCHVPYHDMHME